MTQIYNDPAGGSQSSIGDVQFNTFVYQRKAIIEAKKEMFFGQMSSVENMPKNMGKTIKSYHYLPLLDDANINDQGIDAAGAITTLAVTIEILRPDVKSNGLYVTDYVVGEGANAGAALTAAEAAAVSFFKNNGVYTVSYAATVTAIEALTPAWTVTEHTAVARHGNLYGSSKDVGTISAKLPALSEIGGRVNRVGFKRVELEGSLDKFGFFDEYTKESLDFDTDAQLEMHITREMVNGANEMTEDALQIDLLNSAGIVRYGGTAVSTGELTGEGTPSLITYNDLMRLDIDLDDNRCPKNTTLISGSRMTDTKTIAAARYMYIGSELVPMVRNMEDNFNAQAFIPVQQYAQAGSSAEGEIGSLGPFRIIVVPEMMHWAGAGGAVTTNGGYRESGGNYNVYPMLVVGSESFVNIGFQTDGKSVKFKIKHVKPESNQSYNFQDPYGELGFMSIKWYYGFMLKRPERIALCKTVAEW